ncbi:hypothetical protein K440DRAFT_618470 [Wilcoxina mikolae CBS 423.85]|nr:hypothetical protein K440DRAFT_618470 [Wilcoxina mikolae CBS 423.85]
MSGLQIIYDTTNGPVKDGDDLSGLDLSKVPKFALGESSGINTNAKFIVLMIDPDVNGSPDVVAPQTLHYLRTDFVPTGEAVNIASDIAPAVKYVGPEATKGGNPGPHRYVFLLYKQPRVGFQLKGVNPDQRTGFDVKKWRIENGLEPAIAGVHYLATPPGGASGGTGQPVYTGAPVETGGTTTAQPIETTPPAGGAQTIIHTVTVTGDCSCSTAAPGPGETGGLTLTAEQPIATAPPAAAVTHKVTVGGSAGLVYTPEFVSAAPGDTVMFDFLSRNHTVTQSTLDLPCLFKTGGQKSGFRFNPDSIPGKETFSIVVPDSEPKWYFCAQANHCAQGMVFAINPKDKFPQFKANAMNGTATGSPMPINSTVPAAPVFTGAASGFTAKIGSIMIGLMAVVALTV